MREKACRYTVARDQAAQHRGCPGTPAQGSYPQQAQPGRRSSREEASPPIINRLINAAEMQNCRPGTEYRRDQGVGEVERGARAACLKDSTSSSSSARLLSKAARCLAAAGGAGTERGARRPQLQARRRALVPGAVRMLSQGCAAAGSEGPGAALPRQRACCAAAATATRPGTCSRGRWVSGHVRCALSWQQPRCTPSVADDIGEPAHWQALWTNASSPNKHDCLFGRPVPCQSAGACREGQLTPSLGLPGEQNNVCTDGSTRHAEAHHCRDSPQGVGNCFNNVYST